MLLCKVMTYPACWPQEEGLVLEVLLEEKTF